MKMTVHIPKKESSGVPKSTPFGLPVGGLSFDSTEGFDIVRNFSTCAECTVCRKCKETLKDPLKVALRYSSNLKDVNVTIPITATKPTIASEESQGNASATIPVDGLLYGGVW